MKRSVIFLILILITCQCNAQLEQDKVLHFGVGALCGVGGAILADELSDGNRFWIFTGAVAGSLLAGTAKEALDERQNNSWDNGDLAATVLGGISVGVTIELFSGKKRKARRQAKIAVYEKPLGTSITNTLDDSSDFSMKRMPMSKIMR
ncbi:hypothetical protein [Ulvibacterium sp.]|uniref:hypothetical protein n=1 Tax=Ulvibacterium sp. TaxID=2665914 RepID=UPI003BAA9EEA